MARVAKKAKKRRPPTKVGQRTNNRLDLGRVDPLAAGLDEVLGAPGDDELAGSVDACQVAGGEPAVVVRGRFYFSKVPLDDRRAAHAQVSLDTALVGQGAAFGVGQQQVHAQRGTSGQVRRSRRRIG